MERTRLGLDRDLDVLVAVQNALDVLGRQGVVHGREAGERELDLTALLGGDVVEDLLRLGGVVGLLQNAGVVER